MEKVAESILTVKIRLETGSVYAMFQKCWQDMILRNAQSFFGDSNLIYWLCKIMQATKEDVLTTDLGTEYVLGSTSIPIRYLKDVPGNAF
jgi:hypothetical protein